jgi:hypothetical protein
MTTFLLDIWHDLREKRLWPVAVGLLVATVAVPVVLFKPAAGAPQTPATPPAESAALPVVALDQSSVDNSGLGTFDVNDPFASGADKPATLGGTTGASGVAGAAGGLSDSLFGGTGDSGGTAGGAGGTVPGSSGDSSGGTRYFTYTVDVTFGERDETKKYKDVERLALLPDDKTPIVSFMGMAEGAETAVFFVVDSAIEAEGEGDCNPSPEQCRFIYLNVDDARDEQTLSGADGQLEYSLRLDAIHMKPVSADDVTGDSTPDSTPDTPASAKRRAQYNLATAPKLVAGAIR